MTTLAIIPAWLINATKVIEQPIILFLIGLLMIILFGWYFATEHERKKRNVGTTLVVVVCLLCALAITPPSQKLKGNIDIVGGSEFTMEVQPRLDEDGSSVAVTKLDTENAKQIILKRLDAMGTAEPVSFLLGDNRFVIQMAGIDKSTADSVREKLKTAARLELREVNRETTSLAAKVAAGEEIVAGYKAFKHTYKIKEGTPEEQEITEDILLNTRPAVTGAEIIEAQANQMNPTQVDIVLNSKGEDKMIALTKNMQPQRDRIAIVLDGVCISAPVVNQTPLGKSFMITGLNAKDEAKNLAQNLMNPINNPLEIVQENTVSPTLGEASVKQGLYAGLFGLLGTFLFILIYYRNAGIVALVGLLVNCLILFGVMAMFGFRFSLPGIAGIVLTVGMAVDANVLIYERLREEQAAGKSPKNSIAEAYSKAFTAIFDSNFTSLITAIVLFWLGSGSVKGFAVTLTIGLLASLFSAILVTRVMFRWGQDLHLFNKFNFLNLIKGANYDFMGHAKYAIMFTFGLVILSVGTLAVKKENALGIDFVGGTVQKYQLGNAVTLNADEVTKSLEGANLTKQPLVSILKNAATGDMLTIQSDQKDADTIEQKVAQAFPQLAANKIAASRENMSAKVGAEFLKESMLAVIVGMIGIFLYVAMRYHMTFAVGAIIALFHDVVIACGLVVLFGDQLSAIHVGAVLTIAGYSINDTVIIFDRIRERLAFSTGSLKDIMNEACNATLSRTILTSAATLLTVIALYIFGGAEMKAFSLIMIVGIVIGTYSSIFVGSALVLWWSKLTGKDFRQVQETSGDVSQLDIVG